MKVYLASLVKEEMMNKTIVTLLCLMFFTGIAFASSGVMAIDIFSDSSIITAAPDWWEQTGAPVGTPAAAPDWWEQTGITNIRA